jgi:hypothetical protein
MRERAIEIASALIDEGYDENNAMFVAIAQARHWAENSADQNRDQNLHVIPHPQGWALRRPLSDPSIFIFPTRDEACEYAYDMAEQDGTLVMIHDASGQIEDQIRFERLPLV